MGLCIWQSPLNSELAGVAAGWVQGWESWKAGKVERWKVITEIAAGHESGQYAMVAARRWARGIVACHRLESTCLQPVSSENCWVPFLT